MNFLSEKSKANYQDSMESDAEKERARQQKQKAMGIILNNTIHRFQQQCH